MDVTIVVDPQNDFIIGKFGSQEAVEVRDKIADYLESTSSIVIATQDTHYIGEESEEMKFFNSHCEFKTGGWEIDPKIEPYISLTVPKSTYSTPLPLDEFPIRLKIDKIDIIGFCTNICVLAMAFRMREQFPNVPVKVIGELCAGTTKEGHEAALQILRDTGLLDSGV